MMDDSYDCGFKPHSGTGSAPTFFCVAMQCCRLIPLQGVLPNVCKVCSVSELNLNLNKPEDLTYKSLKRESDTRNYNLNF
jgi:hypothetical protein